MQYALILIALIGYLIAAILSWLVVRKPSPTGHTATAYRLLLLLAFTAHTALGLIRWHTSGTFPVNQLAESIWLLAWFLVLATILTDCLHTRPRKLNFTPFLLIVAVALLLSGLSLGRPTALEVAAWTPLHAITVLLGFAGFALAAVSSLLYLLHERALKNKTANRFADSLPSLETLDRVNFHALAFGFVLVSIGIAVGVTAAISTGQLGTAWWTDSKVFLSLVVWVFYAAVVVCRLVRSLRGRTIAWLTITGFVLVVLTLVGTDLFAPGIHAKLGG